MAASPKSVASKKFSGEKNGDWRAKNSKTFKPIVDDSYSSAVGLYELEKRGGVGRKLFINSCNSTGGSNQQSKQAQSEEPVVPSDKKDCDVLIAG